MMKVANGWYVAIAVLTLVSACGGGGGSSLYSGTPGSGSTPTTPTADNLILTLSKATLANTGSDSVDLEVIATTNSVIAAGADIVLSADSGAVVLATSTTTGTDGKLNGSILIGSSKANRTVTVSATVRGTSITRTASLQVIGARLVGTLVPAVTAPSATGQVQYRLTDQNGGPIAGQAIVVTAAGFAPPSVTATTGANGEYVFSYTAPAAAGSYSITASAGGASDAQTLQVQGGSSTIPPVTAVITSGSVSANPSVLGVNTASSTSSRSEIRALFLASGNVPVPNVRVRFDLAGDLNSVGGSFTTVDSLVYSDGNGVASSAYIAGTRSSPTDGVTIRACYSETDFAAGSCPKSATVRLTLTSEPLGVSIGTNELIIVNELTYVKKFVVSVVDSAGVAKADVDLAVSLDLTNYRKGSYSVGGTSWVKQQTAICANEDSNRNGVLESGEDINGSVRLEPGKSDVSISLLQSKTRADGTAELQIQYAKSFGSWVDAVITVAASGVSGTEGRARYVVAPVPVDAQSLTTITTTPAYVRSPYGVSTLCTDAN